jgi:hypothetical protein
VLLCLFEVIYSYLIGFCLDPVLSRMVDESVSTDGGESSYFEAPVSSQAFSQKKPQSPVYYFDSSQLEVPGIPAKESER